MNSRNVRTCGVIFGHCLSLQKLAGGSMLDRPDKEEVVDMCLTCLDRTSELWQKWPVEGKSRLQRLVMPEGVSLDALNGNRTPKLSLVYAAFPDRLAPKSRMAPPKLRVTKQVIEM